MAITIDWGTKTINVPKADMPVVQATPPVEIRELDLAAFRLGLKDLEDGAQGMVNPDTHRHETETLLGGITYARKIEIVNGYTVTFEEGQYAVNLVGANSNLLDVLNPNQVSVRSSNSAGLIVGQGADPSDIADAVHAKEIEAGLTFLRSQRLVAAAAAALLSGATGGTEDEWVEVRAAVSGTKVRIRALVDRYGNRKQVEYDLSD